MIDWPASIVCRVLKHEVARLRRHQRDFDRGAIAHFADEDDLRRLAQRGAQAIGIAVEIAAQFALIEGGAAVSDEETRSDPPA